MATKYLGSILCFFFTSSVALGQIKYIQNRAVPEDVDHTGIFTVSVGMGQLNNNQLNQWLSANGIAAADHYYHNFEFRALFPSTRKKDRKVFLIGFEGSISNAARPDESDLNTSLVFGKAFRLNDQELYIVPLVGVGVYSLQIQTGNPVPPALVKYNINDGAILRNLFLISPRIMINKRFASRKIKSTYKLSIGLELGCRITFLGGTWSYGGKGQSVNTSGIPNNSIFHPFFSIPIGFFVIPKK